MGENLISIQVIGRKILLKMPKNEEDISLVRTIPYVRWNKQTFLWEIPHYPGNLERLLAYFGNRIHSITKSEEIPVNLKGHSTLQKDQVLMIRTNSGRIKLIFGYLIELIKYIKTIPFHHWDSKNKWWTIPYSEQFEEEIKRKIEELGLTYSYEQEGKNEGVPKASPLSFSNYKKCPADYVNKLKERRYSQNTIRSYIPLFEEFNNHFPDSELDSLGEKEIMDFSRYLVTERKVSSSHQNQAINAVKFYFEKVKGGERKYYYVDRPIREKTLPEVLSEEEVSSLLKATENLKHKAILMTIYSAGLRISELINLKIKDIDSKRMQIRVEQAKGKKDRYTLLSQRTLEVLRIYIKQERPVEYLFEGQRSNIGDSVPYSSRSIQAILKKSISKTKIQKKVTVHTLRHSPDSYLRFDRLKSVRFCSIIEALSATQR